MTDFKKIIEWIKWKVKRGYNVIKGVAKPVASITTVLASIATMVAAFATCETVELMRDEHIQTYKPYLIFRDAEYQEEITYEYSYKSYDSDNLIDVFNKDVSEVIPVTLLIENIGSGTATQLSVEFSFECVDEYLTIICQNYEQEKIKYTDETIEIEYGYYDWDYDHKWEKEDMLQELPYIYEKDDVTVALPIEFKRLIYAVAYCTEGNYESLPPISICINYKDLQGIEYNVEYQLGVKVYSVYDKENNTKNVYYKIKQIK